MIRQYFDRATDHEAVTLWIGPRRHVALARGVSGRVWPNDWRVWTARLEQAVQASLRGDLTNHGLLFSETVGGPARPS
jgi:hypothetical protein